MRLRFPNGEHAEVAFAKGEITIGSGSGNRVSLPHSSLAAQHASVWLDRRGLWLKLGDDGASAHVNARPVRRLAWLRIGDQVTLDQLKFEVHPDPLPALDTKVPPSVSAALDEAQRAIASKVLVRQMSGAQQGRSSSLTQARSIGRGPNTDFILTDPNAPERWVQVELQGDRILMYNPGGKAVTVNGSSVLEAVLAPGDQVSVGGTRFLIEAPGMSPRGADGTSRPAAVSHTQAIKAVRTPINEEHDKQLSLTPEAKDPGAFWWLLAAGAMVAVVITALLVFAPGA